MVEGLRGFRARIQGVCKGYTRIMEKKNGNYYLGFRV